jgi:hypothetical protein
MTMGLRSEKGSAAAGKVTVGVGVAVGGDIELYEEVVKWE